MKLSGMKKVVVGAVAAGALISGPLLTSARAQGARRHRPHPVIIYRYHNPFWYRRYDPFWNPYWGPSTYTVDPIAYQREQGYSKGRSKGKEDAKKGRPANATGQKDYLKSNSLAYREAFVQGYNERFQEELAEIREKAREKQGD